MTSSFQHVTPAALHHDCVRLAVQVRDSGWMPTHMVALWRGGTPMGLVMHEVLALAGEKTGAKVDHICIRTQRFHEPGVAAESVSVDGTAYLKKRLEHDSRLLLVDDVFESGKSLAAVVADLRAYLVPLGRMPTDVRIATLFYKPGHGATTKPDYHVHESDKWIVFPHELRGMSEEVVRAGWPKETADLVYGTGKQ